MFVDGRFSPRLSSVGELPRGDGRRQPGRGPGARPGLVEPWLGRFAKFDRHPFVALNTAFLGDGAFVYVPRGAA